MNGLLDAINNLEALLRPYAPGENPAALAAFGVYVLLILAGGLGAVLSRNLVRALVGLVVTFPGVAGMYLLMASPFMAFMQLLIYVGAVCVLIFFAVMLVKSNPGGEEGRDPSLLQILYAPLAGLAPLAVFGPIIYLNAGRLSTGNQPVDTPLAELGRNLLENYVLPFEIISIVLLVAMAGGVLLSWEKGWNKR